MHRTVHADWLAQIEMAASLKLTTGKNMSFVDPNFLPFKSLKITRRWYSLTQSRFRKSTICFMHQRLCSKPKGTCLHQALAASQPQRRSTWGKFSDLRQLKLSHPLIILPSLPMHIGRLFRLGWCFQDSTVW